MEVKCGATKFDSGSFDSLHSVTFIHDCEDLRVETSVQGIQVYIPQHGPLVMVMIGDKFVGVCQNCGQSLFCTLEEMGEIVGEMLTGKRA